MSLFSPFLMIKVHHRSEVSCSTETLIFIFLLSGSSSIFNFLLAAQKHLWQDLIPMSQNFLWPTPLCLSLLLSHPHPYSHSHTHTHALRVAHTVAHTLACSHALSMYRQNHKQRFCSYFLESLWAQKRLWYNFNLTSWAPLSNFIPKRSPARVEVTQTMWADP